MRTVFSTVGMEGVGAFWVLVHRGSVGLAVTLMLTAASAHSAAPTQDLPRPWKHMYMHMHMHMHMYMCMHG